MGRIFSVGLLCYHIPVRILRSLKFVKDVSVASQSVRTSFILCVFYLYTIHSRRILSRKLYLLLGLYSVCDVIV